MNGADFIKFTGEENMLPEDLQRGFLNSIAEAGTLIVCNVGGYIGMTVAGEIGYAFCQFKNSIDSNNAKTIYLLEEYKINYDKNCADGTGLTYEDCILDQKRMLQFINYFKERGILKIGIDDLVRTNSERDSSETEYEK